jgi:hypothetical protein
VLAARTPTLLFWFAGAFLLRLAARTFLAWFANAPFTIVTMYTDHETAILTGSRFQKTSPPKAERKGGADTTQDACKMVRK